MPFTSRRTRLVAFFAATLFFAWLAPVLPPPVGPLISIGGLTWFCFWGDGKALRWIDAGTREDEGDGTSGEDDSDIGGRAA